MSYNNAIPQGTDNISVSQGQILGNFGTAGIDSTSFGFSREHVTMTDATNGGLHKQVTLLTPVAASGTGVIGILHSVAAAGITFPAGKPIPYFANTSGDLPMIPDVLNTGTNYGYQQGNLIYNFGRSVIVQGASSVNVTWKTPFTTAALTVIMTIRTTGTGSSGSTKITSADGTTTTGTFSVYGAALSSGNLEFWYYAVGY